MRDVRGRGHWFSSAAGVLALLIPKGMCPFCIAAGGSLLSSVGLGFLARGSVLRWVLPALLLVGIGFLVASTRRHRRWGVLVPGVMGPATLAAGWFSEHRPGLYLGMAMVTVASAIDLWAKRHPVPPRDDLGSSGEPPPAIKSI